MSHFQHIDVQAAHQLMETQQARLVDIRDLTAFSALHAEHAFHLTNDTVVDFMQEVDFEEPVLVICYHGNSSQGVAEYLFNQGYEQVYSVDGGIEAWKRAQLPVVTDMA